MQKFFPGAKLHVYSSSVPPVSQVILYYNSDFLSNPYACNFSSKSSWLIAIERSIIMATAYPFLSNILFHFSNVKYCSLFYTHKYVNTNVS